MTDVTADCLRSFFNLWVNTLAQVLQQVSGKTVPCTLLFEAPTNASPPGDDDLWLLTSLSSGLRGELCIRVPRPAATIFGRMFLGESAASSELATSENEEAVLELLRQVGGLVATGGNSSWGEVHIHIDRSNGAPSWPASSKAWLRAGDEGPGNAILEIQISAALAAALRTDVKQGFSTADNDRPTVGDSPKLEVKLDLLMDVDLAITLRFGGRRMLLRDVLDLNPGAVVELDRQVNDPVDMLLDGRVVARGEVVVVDGNYGLRITDIGAGD